MTSPLSEADENYLLRLARQALENCVLRRRADWAEEPPESLRVKCGAFVTLRKAGYLRGCIGHVERSTPLYQTVRDCAIAAALRDPRFEPLTPEEVADVRIEISVLSGFADVRPEDIEVGRHGLLVSRGLQRGLLLPQVASQWNWDGEKFLEETCLKAGLPPDAWRHGARVQAFTAQVFGEPEGLPSPGALRAVQAPRL